METNLVSSDGSNQVETNRLEFLKNELEQLKSN